MPAWKQPIGRTHLDLDGEGVDEVFWDAVRVPGGVHAHRDELALKQQEVGSEGNESVNIHMFSEKYDKNLYSFFSGNIGTSLFVFNHE